MQSKIDVLHSGIKQKGIFILIHSSLRSTGYGLPGRVSKDGEIMILVIKTTVAILDTGTSKHQGVTM